MNKSESLKELATALAKAQGKIKGAVKDADNPFFKSKYADLASVVEAIREAFSINGLCYVQHVHSSEKNEVAVETIILHSSGEWLSCGILALPVTKADAQGFGSALTYARRYSLSAAAGVAPEDDDGNAAAKAKPAQAAPASAASMKTTADNCWEGLREDQKKEVQNVADCVMQEFENKGPSASLDMLRDESKHWEPEYKAALTSRFPADIKKAWNKLDKERKESESLVGA